MFAIGVTEAEETGAEERSTRLQALLGDERTVQVSFLLELAEFDRGRQYESFGYATLWDYCARELRLQTGQIFRRTNAARLVRAFPAVADYLRDGRLSMTTLVELRDVLTAENAKELLDSASWKSKEDVAYLALCRKPKPVVAQDAGASSVRKLPARRPAPVPQVPLVAAPALPLVAPAPAPRVEPVHEDRFSLNIRFDEAFKTKLAKAREALSHSVRNGDLLSVIERGLDLILEAAAKKRDPAAVGPRAVAEGATPEAPASGRTHVPADLARKVWRRDEHCCTWTLASGERCRSTWQLELDHVTAVALGGTTDLANLRLLCRAHNQLHARQTFGAAHMERATSARSR